MICENFCFKPDCNHGKICPEGRIGPGYPYIDNTFNIDDKGEIVGYNYKVLVYRKI